MQLVVVCNYSKQYIADIVAVIFIAVSIVIVIAFVFVVFRADIPAVVICFKAGCIALFVYCLVFHSFILFSCLTVTSQACFIRNGYNFQLITSVSVLVYFFLFRFVFFFRQRVVTVLRQRYLLEVLFLQQFLFTILICSHQHELAFSCYLFFSFFFFHFHIFILKKM